MLVSLRQELRHELHGIFFQVRVAQNALPDLRGTGSVCTERSYLAMSKPADTCSYASAC